MREEASTPYEKPNEGPSSLSTVQPVRPEAQAYEAFNIDQETFDVDVKRLDRTFRQLQTQLHPDKFASNSPVEQEHAANQSAFVNGAYSTLKDPLARAYHLLGRKGGSDGQGGEATIEDPELLMVVMETREQIEEAASPVELQQLQKDNAAKQTDCVQKLGAAFAANDLKVAEEFVTQLRYLRTAGDAISLKL
ncbi:hypothetical protein WJX74_010489 [Apatococcus lobatus]|uniref:J domain-containing protein n=1 Tax=Apatococcus lobatus TaxID=904363 RepID=A0AAW1S313_9CHLO